MKKIIVLISVLAVALTMSSCFSYSEVHYEPRDSMMEIEETAVEIKESEENDLEGHYVLQMYEGANADTMQSILDSAGFEVTIDINSDYTAIENYGPMYKENCVFDPTTMTVTIEAGSNSYGDITVETEESVMDYQFDGKTLKMINAEGGIAVFEKQ